MSQFKESLIFKGILHNSEYYTTIMPQLEKSVFDSKVSRALYKGIDKFFIANGDDKPTISVFESIIDDATLSEDSYKEALELLESIKEPEKFNTKWLVDETMEFIKKKLTYNAIFDAATKLDSGEIDYGLSDKLNDINGKTTESSIGMDFDDIENRWDLYHTVETHLPFRVQTFNDITNGGLMRGTITCFISNKSGGGKSAVMTSLASDYMRLGYNVLYISLEMSEASVMQRIDANMLNLCMDDIRTISKNEFISRHQLYRPSDCGKIKVKQYPTSTASVVQFRKLLKDLSLKEHFIPDIIMVDYLNIMASSRARNAEKVADHTIKKFISEELRGLAIETDTVLITAVQSNRGGASADTALDVDDIAEAYGIIYVMDMIMGLINTEEGRNSKKLTFTQLKNRYRDIAEKPVMELSMDFSKMTLSDDGLVNSALPPDEAQSQKASETAEELFGKMQERRKEEAMTQSTISKSYDKNIEHNSYMKQIKEKINEESQKITFDSGNYKSIPTNLIRRSVGIHRYMSGLSPIEYLP